MRIVVPVRSLFDGNLFAAVLMTTALALACTSFAAAQTPTAPSASANSATANISGVWVWSRVASDGTGRRNFFTFHQQGSTLSGEVEYPWGGSATIKKGTVDGTKVRFVTGSDTQAPEYNGSLDGDHLHLTLREKNTSKAVELVRLKPGELMFPPAAALPALKAIPANGLASRPPMGWNAWNHFHDTIDDKTVRQVADAMIASGMRDAGYEYVNIDDEWAGERDPRGFIHSNREFPDMKALADYVHGKQMKLGLYSSPGPETCEGHRGSMGHEEQDAQTYAALGADYLKYDWCSAAFVYRDDDMRAAYQKMGESLQRTGRPIVYSLCQYGKVEVPRWGTLADGNLWRTTSDISDNWKSMIWIWKQQQSISQWNKAGGWNDPDMLEVGNGGMSDEEYCTHFSLWSLLSAPLIAGNDPRSMSAATIATLTNKDVIAIDQDALAAPPRRADFPSPVEVWMKPLAGGDTAVLLLNATDTASTIDLSWSAIGLDGRRVRDLWNHKELDPDANFKAEIPSHGVRMMRLLK